MFTKKSENYYKHKTSFVSLKVRTLLTHRFSQINYHSCLIIRYFAYFRIFSCLAIDFRPLGFHLHLDCRLLISTSIIILFIILFFILPIPIPPSHCLNYYVPLNPC